jgi:hypothetical protein
MIREICGQNGIPRFSFAKSVFQIPLPMPDIAKSDFEFAKSGLENPLSGSDIAKSELQIPLPVSDLTKSASDIPLSGSQIPLSDPDLTKSKPDITMSELQKRLSKAGFAIFVSHFRNEMSKLFAMKTTSKKLEGAGENYSQNPIFEKFAANRRFQP